MYKTNTFLAVSVLTSIVLPVMIGVLVIEKRKSDVKKMSQVLTPLQLIHSGLR
jgi:hypothetical protein